MCYSTYNDPQHVSTLYVLLLKNLCVANIGEIVLRQCWQQLQTLKKAHTIQEKLAFFIKF